MPPVVDLEKALLRPGLRIGAHPGDALALPALHLHHMGDRVLGPAVARLELDRAAAGGFRAGVVAGLLQPEGVHAEHGMVAGHRRVPGRQGAGDAVAQHAAVAGEIVDLVAGLQRQRVARMVDRDVLQRLARGVPAAGGEMAERGDVGRLARARRQRGRRLVAGPRDRCRCGLAERVAGEAAQRMQRVLVAVAARRARAAEGMSVQVADHQLAGNSGLCWRRA